MRPGGFYQKFKVKSQWRGLKTTIERRVTASQRFDCLEVTEKPPFYGGLL